MAFFRSISLASLALPFVSSSPVSSPRGVFNRAALGEYWNGFSSIKYFFPFGDSYTTTTFNTSGIQPSPSNPLGNPPYPGYTSSNGPNWIDYLTTTYNQSLIETYNLAYGGATVDSALVAQYLPIVLDFIQQVNDEFIPDYVDKDVPWTASNTLFATFFGINDVGNSYGQKNASLNADIITVYTAQLELLYDNGARNFLILNVPPVDRSPGTTVQGQAAVSLEASDIGNFNFRIQSMANNFQSRHQDATVFQFDTNWLFTRVLNHPNTTAQTAGYKNTTAYCPAYENGTPTPTTFNASCGIPVNEYFWLNTLHPTYPMHEALADQIAMMLEAHS